MRRAPGRATLPCVGKGSPRKPYTPHRRGGTLDVGHEVARYSRRSSDAHAAQAVGVAPQRHPALKTPCSATPLFTYVPAHCQQLNHIFTEKPLPVNISLSWN